jgi:hypothetical protein
MTELVLCFCEKNVGKSEGYLTSISHVVDVTLQTTMDRAVDSNFPKRLFGDLHYLRYIQLGVSEVKPVCVVGGITGSEKLSRIVLADGCPASLSSASIGKAQLGSAMPAVRLPRQLRRKPTQAEQAGL